MSTYYSQGTVTPYLPASSFTNEDLETLESLGYEYDKLVIKDNDMLYFYIPSNRELPYEESDVSDTDIFSKALMHDSCNDILHVVIEGAYTCDKMRQGEFGGWAAIITRNGVQDVCTSELINDLLNRNNIKEQNKIVEGLAKEVESIVAKIKER